MIDIFHPNVIVGLCRNYFLNWFYNTMNVAMYYRHKIPLPFKFCYAMRNWHTFVTNSVDRIPHKAFISKTRYDIIYVYNNNNTAVGRRQPVSTQSVTYSLNIVFFIKCIPNRNKSRDHYFPITNATHGQTAVI